MLHDEEKRILAGLRLAANTKKMSFRRLSEGSFFILLITNILFGNYRLPIKIYYICSHTVDKKKHPAVGTVFLVAKGRFCMRRKCLEKCRKSVII